MDNKDEKLLNLLAKSYPNIGAVSTEIINLQAILTLPKGTEHFLSDLHGEYEAFLHLRNSASGIIREKIDLLFGDKLSEADRSLLATVIYYPKEKIEEVAQSEPDMYEWYRITLNRIMEVCRLIASKYTRSKVRKLLPPMYAYIIEELLSHTHSSINKRNYYDNIISSIVETGRGKDFICSVSDTIKRLAVDRLHIVGDIFDRGTRADIIMESISSGVNLDIQWGNHDILWMGAAGGSDACIAAVLNNSITYGNLDVIEIGYGISLRPLAVFANAVYSGRDVSAFMPKSSGYKCSEKDTMLIARMHKAISIIQFKAEAALILRNPSFDMNERILLDKIDYEKGTVKIDGKDYPLSDTDFPTVDKNDPLKLTPGEEDVLSYLSTAFGKSEKLQRHIDFLFDSGDIYKCFNSNLLFHGCVPLNDDGSFMNFEFDGKSLHGKALMDYFETTARQGFYAGISSPKKQKGLDIMWYLWCGKNSPLCGRMKIATFERLLIDDKTAYEEPKNAYYAYVNDNKVVDRILKEFGLPLQTRSGLQSHIINGHVPVISKSGENPVKCGGRLIVIDGGLCKAYRKTTGIAGYTLIYSSNGMRISAHEPFEGKEKAVREGSDILSTSVLFERPAEPIRVAETDGGKRIAETVADLKKLLAAYECGEIKENIHVEKYRK
ncbi:MAG: fructose-1,6-bisphosphatase [Bacillota bacterium]|nr:fructose-1,6-bisphosphatase [Bacillota bacterium]